MFYTYYGSSKLKKRLLQGKKIKYRYPSDSLSSSQNQVDFLRLMDNQT